MDKPVSLEDEQSDWEQELRAAFGEPHEELELTSEDERILDEIWDKRDAELKRKAAAQRERRRARRLRQEHQA